MRSTIHRRLHVRFGKAEVLRSRRAFLRQGALAAAGWYLSGCSGFGRRPRTASVRPRVAIVGGGLAGLACAFELAGAGADVVVLEARRRLGGRVHTLDRLVPGRTVEAGASLIGANHATWLTYAERFALELIDVTTEPEDAQVPIVVGGERLDAASAEALYASLASAESVLAGRSAAVVDPLRPWTAAGAADLDATSLGSVLDGLGLEPSARALVEVVESNNNVSPTAVQSLLGMLAAVAGGGGEAYFTESEVYRCRGGNSRLVHALAAALGPAVVRSGTPVASVTWRADGAEVATETGDVLEVDRVVIAVPPSTWDRIRFDPALPADLVATMGPAIKVLAPVDRAYWAEDGWSQYGLSDGPVAMTWDGTYGQAAGGPAALVGFAGGTAAETCLAVPVAEREAFFDRQLEEMMPGFSEHRTRRPVFVRWPEDRWTRSGYSAPALGDVTRVGPRLAAGVGCVTFAGEHASPAFFGYMEGALESGARLARRLARAEALALG